MSAARLTFGPVPSRRIGFSLADESAMAFNRPVGISTKGYEPSNLTHCPATIFWISRSSGEG